MLQYDDWLAVGLTVLVEHRRNVDDTDDDDLARDLAEQHSDRAVTAAHDGQWSLCLHHLRDAVRFGGPRFAPPLRWLLKRVHRVDRTHVLDQESIPG